MKLTLIVVLVSLLTARASRIDDYNLPSAPANPMAVVEKFLMEQPEKQRPESANVTAEYLEFGDAMWIKHGAWAGRDEAKSCPNLLLVHRTELSVFKGPVLDRANA